MGKLYNLVLRFVTTLVGMIFRSFLIAFPVKWTWNYAVVDALNASRIDFCHAMWLAFLCSILFQAASGVEDLED